MQDAQPSYFIGLDVGTSKARCVVGSIDIASEEPRISVVGYGSALNSGMRKGLVVHLDDAADAINQAISEAERISGIPIRSATVNVNGAHISGLDSTGVVAISSANREINIEDKLRAEDAATIVQIPHNREIIQVFPKNYRVDGHDTIKDPLGMNGVRLEVDTHIVTVATPNIRSLDAALAKAHIHPSHHTISGLAAAEAVLNRQQKEAGALVIDIGASTTNLAVIEDGEVQHVAVIAMGGMHITNDLAIGLKTDLEIAEKVKIHYARLDGKNKTTKVSVQYQNKNHIFDPDDIALIVEARVDEIFDLVDKELKKIHKSRKLPGGVVLAGGTANIPGLAGFAKEKLQLAARVGSLSHLEGIVEDIQKPDFITAIGLMQLDMIFSQQLGNSNESRLNTGSLMNKLIKLIGKFK